MTNSMIRIQEWSTILIAHVENPTLVRVYKGQPREQAMGDNITAINSNLKKKTCFYK